MTFTAILAGVEISSVLWVLALIVARFYGSWRRWDGWTELRLDLVTLRRVAQAPSSSSNLVVAGGIGAVLGWSAAWAAFLYALSS